MRPRPRSVTLLGGTAPPAAKTSTPAAEEDDVTIRVRVEDAVPIPAPPPLPIREAAAPAPPPLPSGPRAAEAPLGAMEAPLIAMEAPLGAMEAPLVAMEAPLVAMEVPTNPDGAQRRAQRDRYVKIAAGIFAAGVLVGVVGSATMKKDGDVRVVEPAAQGAPAANAPKLAAAAIGASKPAPLSIDAQKPAPPAPPKVQAADLAVERRDPVDEKKTEVPSQAGGSTREAVVLQVSGSSAPSCEQLLGKGFGKKKDPKGALRETRLANRELVLGNVPEAQRAYCEAFALDRKNIDRHVNLGRFYLFRRDWEQAAKYGQSALKLDPNHRRALGVVGDAWAALDKPDEARSAWLAAERKTNASKRELGLMVRRNFALGKKVERLKDFSLAERLYRRVLLLDPKHAGAMRGIASCLLKVGDYQGAEAWARRADMLKRTR